MEKRLTDAGNGLRTAPARDPAAASTPFARASALLDSGNVAGARAIVVSMATGGADRHAIHWLRARIAMACGEPETARKVLSDLLADPRLDQEQRTEALLLLGIALGDLGLPVEAFAAAADGKRLQRTLFADQAAAREGEVAKLRRIATWIGATHSDWRSPLSAPVPGEAATHVFLLGFPRSGTTLLEQMLAAHPRVIALEEEATLATPYEAFLSSPEACAALMQVDGDEAAAWAAHYWQGVGTHGFAVEGKVFVDKQPAGTLNLPVIARLFPRAKILFALRDPRDVVLSCFRQPFRINAMTYAFTDLAEAAACYDACLTLAGMARSRMPLAWHDVRHEQLVEDFDGEIARVLAFLGLEFDPAMADFANPARARPIRTPSATQVRAGLNRHGLRRWQAYRQQLAPVLPMLAPWVGRLGY